jgi:hypothetical protein
MSWSMCWDSSECHSAPTVVRLHTPAPAVVLAVFVTVIDVVIVSNRARIFISIHILFEMLKSNYFLQIIALALLQLNFVLQFIHILAFPT